MDVIIISGPSGSGKSTLIKYLDSNYQNININFRNCKNSDKNPTSLISKLDYTKKWFDKIEELYYRNYSIIISDRSPFDNLAYLQESRYEHFKSIELEFQKLKLLGINFHTILVTADSEILIERITMRNRIHALHNISYKEELDLLPNSLEYFEGPFFINNLEIDSGSLSERSIYMEVLDYIRRSTTANTAL